MQKYHLSSILIPALLLSLCSVSAQADLKKKQRKAVSAMAPAYQVWISEVELLITSEEVDAFIALEKDYQRDAFIKRFWQVRDPYPQTARNEFKDRWHESLAYAQGEFGGLKDDRGRFLMRNGPPTSRLEVRCSLLFPLEVWYYKGSLQVGFQFYLVFYQPSSVGPFRIFHPEDGLGSLFNTFSVASDGSTSLAEVDRQCRDGDLVRSAISWVLGQGNGYISLLSRLDSPPEPPEGEWVATFAAYSTDLPEGAPTFEASLDVAYPGRKQNRTVMQAVIGVAVDQATQVDLGDYGAYNFLLNGEVLKDGELFESFRYKFDFPTAETSGPTLPMIIQRTLRSGEYKLVVKLEDLNSHRFFRAERILEVPKLEIDLPPPGPEDPETARLLAEANAAITSGETTIQLVEPSGQLLTGMLRLETLTTGDDFHRVTFSLDGKPVLTKRRPPYSVEVDLGSLPRTRTLKVAGYDSEGKELATDEVLLNASDHRFAVRLIEPRKGKTYHNSLQAQVEVSAPEGGTVERLEIYLNEDLLATLYQPPYTQPILLPGGNEIAYVRAVAYLTDGGSTEDLVFVNAPDNLDEVDVQFVELYTTVLDRQSRPVKGLTREDFSVAEDGAAQTITRFEQVRDLPFHAGVLLDVSASMDESLDTVRDAALKFFEEAISPKDRAALVTFNDRPHLAVKFTSKAEALAGALAGLKAERGTSLYDSLIFGLYYFNGIRGQKAILLLSDGKDESSRFSFEDTLEYARRAGVTIYAIGLKEAGKDGANRRKLSRLSEITGGRSFFIDDPAELAGIYQTIQEELRSQYLVAYQSTNTSGDAGFREVQLRVAKPGTEVKTLSGYYP